MKSAACVHHYVMVRGGMACQKCGHVMGAPEPRPESPAAKPRVVTSVTGVPRELIAARAVSYARIAFYRGFAYGWVGATICGMLIWWLA